MDILKHNPFTTKENLISTIRSNVFSKHEEFVPIMQRNIKQTIYNNNHINQGAKELQEQDFSIIRECYDPFDEKQNSDRNGDNNEDGYQNKYNNPLKSSRIHHNAQFIDVQAFDSHISQVLQDQKRRQQIIQILKLYQQNKQFEQNNIEYQHKQISNKPSNIDQQQQQSRQYINAQLLEDDQPEFKSMNRMNFQQLQNEQIQQRNMSQQQFKSFSHLRNSQQYEYPMKKMSIIEQVQMRQDQYYQNKRQFKKIMNTQEQFRVYRYHLKPK